MNSRPLRYFSIILLSVFALPSYAISTVAGVTPGKLSVSATGQATYSLPVQVPPGIAGIEPNLTLNYSSGRGNGIAGVGWSIGGLSTIHRCTKTPAQDGQWGGINYTAEDRFCIDGKRLVAINGVYGAAGTEYRTEIDSFAKIVSYGVQGSGPAWFRVWTKSGRIMEYGNTANSRVEAVFATGVAGPGVRVWAINRMGDAVGNYMSYTYVEDSISGAHRVTEIIYTYNDAAAVSAHSNVRFIYEARPDVTNGYMGGALSTNDVRLAAIRTYADGTVVRNYGLTYETGAATGRSRLLSVTECDGIGGTENCLAPTTFNWKAEKAGFTSDVGYVLPAEITSVNAVSFIDLNGDGLQDLIWAFKLNGVSTRKAWLNTGAGWVESIEYLPLFDISVSDTISPSGRVEGQFVDLNGDGLPDFLRAVKVDGISYRAVWLNTGSGWQDSPAHLPNFDLGRYWRVRQCSFGSCFYKNHRRDYGGEFIDLDGNGLTDFIQSYKWGASIDTHRIAWLNTGSGWQESLAYRPPSFKVVREGYGRQAEGMYLDINGDTLADFIRAVYLNGVYYQTAWLNTGNGWQESDLYRPPFVFGIYWTKTESICGKEGCESKTTKHVEPIKSKLIDVNGDNLSDLVQAHGTNLGSWLSTGKGWKKSLTYKPPVSIYGKGTEGMFLDVNGDGLTDLIRAVYLNGVYYQTAWLNTGNGWQEDTAYRPPFVFGKFWKTTETSCGKEGCESKIVNHRETTQNELTDVNGDGLRDLVLSRPSNKLIRDTWLLNSVAPDQFLSVSDSLGALVKMSYRPLTDKTVYDKANDAVFPIRDVQPSHHVISTISRDDGIGGQKRTAYRYAGAKIDFSGRTINNTRFTDLGLGIVSRYESGGLGGDSETTEISSSKSTGIDFHGSTGAGYLGFKTVTATDLQTGIVTSNRYRQDYPYIGLTDFSKRTIPDSSGATGGTRIAEITKLYESRSLNLGANLFPYISRLVDKRFEPAHGHGNLPITTTVTTGLYDDYGNPTQTTATTSGGGKTFTKRTDSVFSNSASNWQIGKLTRETLKNTLPTGINTTRTTAFAYHSTGLLRQKVIEPDSTTLRLTTDYARDVFGHMVKETISGSDIVTRSKTSEYSAAAPNYGRFITRRSNALGHAETSTYDNRFGTPKTLTSPNGVTTSWVYDGFAHKIRENRADGTATRWLYRTCGTATWCEYYIHQLDIIAATNAKIGNEQVNWYDALNRSTLNRSTGFDGTFVYVDTGFNARGEVIHTTRPYFAGTVWADRQFIRTTYDNVSRPKTVTAPDGGVDTITYKGLTTSTTNALGQVAMTVKNAVGQTIQVTDAAGTRILNAYTPFGNLARTEVRATDGANTITSMGYDIRGRKKSMNDPDMGSWTYAYNALGELVSQTNAKLKIARMGYDKLGRLTSRTEAEGTTTWVYDNALKTAGIGKLDKISRSQDTYVKDLFYDALGRPSKTAITFEGKRYVTDQSYDTAGRPHVLTYPSLDSLRFAVANTYTASGYLKQVSGGGTVFWQALDADAEGNITEAKLGNGLSTVRDFTPATNRVNSIVTYNGLTPLQDLGFEFDTLGNLKSRTDFGQSRKESFVYDTLNRLRSATVVDTGSLLQLNKTSATYDLLGNITAKSDVGNYAYNGVDGGAHAVTKAGNRTYRYSANGEMLASANATTGASLRSAAWSSFNKPTRITAFDTGSVSNFAYGPDRSRIKQTAYQNGSLTRATTYIGNLFERHAATGKVDEWVHYIRAGNTVAIYTRVPDGNPATNNHRYLHRDHLDSVSLVTNEAGGVVEARSFDAWGKPRNADWTKSTSKLTLDETKRGFTGHEHLDNVGLIHMNGRVQDPGLGRFISADPTMQFVDVAQNYNRYSYVLNNPLSFTDPSGFHLGSDTPGGSRDLSDNPGNWGGGDDSNRDGGSNEMDYDRKEIEVGVGVGSYSVVTTKETKTITKSVGPVTETLTYDRKTGQLIEEKRTVDLEVKGTIPGIDVDVTVGYKTTVTGNPNVAGSYTEDISGGLKAGSIGAAGSLEGLSADPYSSVDPHSPTFERSYRNKAYEYDADRNRSLAARDYGNPF